MAFPAAASADTFSFTGAEQTYVVPAGVTAVHIEATGAAGMATTASTGGKGATVGGTLAVTPAQTLYVEVGGVGQCNGAAPANQAGAGGGAADVRTISVTDGGGSLCPQDPGPVLQPVGRLAQLAADRRRRRRRQRRFPEHDQSRRRRRPGGARRAPAGQAGTDSAGGAGGAAAGHPADNPGAPGTLGLGGQGDAPFGAAGGGGGGLYGGGGGALIFSPTLTSYGGGGGSSLVPPGGSGPVITTLRPRSRSPRARSPAPRRATACRAPWATT